MPNTKNGNNTVEEWLITQILFVEKKSFREASRREIFQAVFATGLSIHTKTFWTVQKTPKVYYCGIWSTSTWAGSRVAVKRCCARKVWSRRGQQIRRDVPGHRGPAGAYPLSCHAEARRIRVCRRQTLKQMEVSCYYKIRWWHKDPVYTWY